MDWSARSSIAGSFGVCDAQATSISAQIANPARRHGLVCMISLPHESRTNNVNGSTQRASAPIAAEMRQARGVFRYRRADS
jgi:hypothetical protein